MSALIKYVVLFSICICLKAVASANAIDSLKTKEQVRLLLTSHLDTSGIIYMKDCAELFWPKIQIPCVTYIDTYEVEEPVTREMVQTTITKEYDSYGRGDTVNYQLNYSFDKLAEILKGNNYEFYRADIDGNGYTDMVIKAYDTYVIMDMGYKLEGHLLSDSPDFSSYEFKNFILLPGNIHGILLSRKSCLPDTVAGIRPSVTDTVVYVFNSFAKYNSQFEHVGITSLNYHYRRSTGLGDFQVFIEINKNGQCYLYDGRRTSSALLDSTSLDNLWNLISYLDIKSENNGDYYLSINHAIGTTFTVNFDDGTAKLFAFWSYTTPMGLGYLSRHLGLISRTLPWRSSGKHIDWDYIRKKSVEKLSGKTDEYSFECDNGEW